MIRLVKGAKFQGNKYQENFKQNDKESVYPGINPLTGGLGCAIKDDRKIAIKGFPHFKQVVGTVRLSISAVKGNLKLNNKIGEGLIWVILSA